MSIKNYSVYSVDAGMLSIDDILGQEFTQKTQKAVLTDYNTLMGVPEFLDKANKKGVIPIIGATVSIKSDNDVLGDLTLYAKNKNGFDNLKKIISNLEEDNFKDKSVDIEHILDNSKDLIALTGGHNTVLYNSLKKLDKDSAQRHLYFLRKCFKDDIFFEIQDINDSDIERINNNIINISKSNDIPLLATNNNRMKIAGHHPLLVEKIKVKKGINNKKNDLIENYILKSDYVKSSSEMNNYFSKYINNITNLNHLFQRIESFNLFVDIPEIPDFPGIDDEQHFIKVLNEKYRKFIKNIPDNKKPIYEKRYKEELDIIKELNFEKYFTIFVQIEQNKIENQKFNLRGSVVSFLIAHILGLSDVDPVKHGLLAERFLNKNRLIRHELPDIDLESNNVEATFKYLVDTFGKKNVAYLSNSSKPKAKSQINLAKKAIQKDIEENPLNADGGARYFPEKEFDIILKVVNNMYGHKMMTFDELFENGYVSKFNASKYMGIKGDFNSKEFKNEYYKINSLKSLCKDTDVKKVIGYIRQLNNVILTHEYTSASVVTSNEPIENCFSTHFINKDGKKAIDIAIEAGKKYVEKLGLIKLDILPNLYLDKLAQSYSQLKLDWDEEKSDFPYSYKPVYDMIGKGLTETLNQIKSPSQRELAKRVKVEDFNELVNFLALLRPAVGKANIDTYVENKENKNKIYYEHPLMKDVLEKTYGVLIFEEQIMEIAQKVGSFTKEESDDFRSIMKKMANSKKDNVEVLNQYNEMKNEFYKRAISIGNIDEESVNKILERLDSIKGYTFSKAHSLSYASLVYRQALVDVKYPAEYIENFILENNSRPSKLEEFNEYINKCIELDRNFLNLDINRSLNNFKTRNKGELLYIDPSIQYIIKDKDFSELIVNERVANGAYKNIYDFIERTLPKYTGEGIFSGTWLEKKASNNLTYKRFVLDLIKSGAFDSIAPEELRLAGKSQVRTSLASSVDLAMDLATNPFISEDFVYNVQNNPVSDDTLINDEIQLYGYSPSKIKIEQVKKKQSLSLENNNEQSKKKPKIS